MSLAVLSGLLGQLEPSIDWLDTLGRATAYGLLLFVFWLLVTKRLVFGWAYAEMREDRDFWRHNALQGLDVGEKAVEIARKKK